MLKRKNLLLLAFFALFAIGAAFVLPVFLSKDDVGKQESIKTEGTSVKKPEGAGEDTGTADGIGKEDIADKIKISLCALSADPDSYVGREVEVSGVVELSGKSYSGGNFLLEDGACKVSVSPWRILEEAPCPKEPCERSETMLDYLDKKVSLSGTFKGFSDTGCQDNGCDNALTNYRISTLEESVRFI